MGQGEGLLDMIGARGEGDGGQFAPSEFTGSAVTRGRLESVAHGTVVEACRDPSPGLGLAQQFTNLIGLRIQRTADAGPRIGRERMLGTDGVQRLSGCVEGNRIRATEFARHRRRKALLPARPRVTHHDPAVFMHQHIRVRADVVPVDRTAVFIDNQRRRPLRHGKQQPRDLGMTVIRTQLPTRGRLHLRGRHPVQPDHPLRQPDRRTPGKRLDQPQRQLRAPTTIPLRNPRLIAPLPLLNIRHFTRPIRGRIPRGPMSMRLGHRLRHESHCGIQRFSPLPRRLPPRLDLLPPRRIISTMRLGRLDIRPPMLPVLTLCPQHAVPLDTHCPLVARTNRVIPVGTYDALVLGMYRTIPLAARHAVPLRPNGTIAIRAHRAVANGRNRAITIAQRGTIAVAPHRAIALVPGNTVALGPRGTVTVGQHRALALGPQRIGAVGAHRTVAVRTNDTVVDRWHGTVAPGGIPIGLHGTGTVRVCGGVAVGADGGIVVGVGLGVDGGWFWLWACYGFGGGVSGCGLGCARADFGCGAAGFGF